MTASFKIAGLREIDSILAVLPKATSKGVVRRALAKELKPVAAMANQLWPGSDERAFGVSATLQRGQRAPEIGPNAVRMFVGSTRSAPHAHLLEWGTAPRYHKSGKFVGATPPTPSLTPAWEAHRGDILEGLAATLRRELEATMARKAKRRR